jgi:chromosome segregation ATPase
MKVRVIIFILAAGLFLGLSGQRARCAENSTLENDLDSKIMELGNDLYLLQEKVNKQAESRKEIKSSLREHSQKLESQNKLISELQDTVNRLDKELLETDEVVYSIKNNYSQVIEDMDSLRSRLKSQDKEFSSRLDKVDKDLNLISSDLSKFKEDIQVQMNAVNDAVGSGVSGLEKKMVSISDTVEKRKEALDLLEENQKSFQKEVEGMEKALGELKKELHSFRRKSSSQQDRLVLLFQERVLIWGGLACGIMLLLILLLLIRTSRLARVVRAQERKEAPQPPQDQKSSPDDQALGWLEKRGDSKEE